MSKFIFYLKLPEYKKQWLEHTFGSPVVFPKHSYENLVILTLIGKRPKGKCFEKPEKEDCAFAIPYDRIKPSHIYNYMSNDDLIFFAKAIDRLIRINIWNEIASNSNCKDIRIQDLFYSWCLRHGVSYDNVESVRQKYYRMRKCFEKYGLIMGEKYKKCSLFEAENEHTLM